MKAIVKNKAEVGLWMEDVPVPSMGINDVLIKVEKTAICGSDVHIYNWDAWARKTIPVPLVIGHEFVGVVEEIGSNVHDFHPGDLVSGEGHIVCGHCRNCLAGRRHLCMNTSGIGINRDGAFAEYVSVPVTNVWFCDPNIPREILAFFDPLGNAAHTALSFDLLGEDVLITGAGPIGIMATAISRHAGARHIVVTDVNTYRLELAATMGATRVVDVTREDLGQVTAELGMKEGFDVGLEMSGNGKAFKQMLAHMCHGGKVALLGIQEEALEIDWNEVIFNGLTIKGIYGREMYETWYKVTSMLQTGLNVAPVLTHCFDFNDFEEAFKVMRSGDSGKVIMNWT